ncbi:MAG: M48 family metallopeptidase [Nitrospiria bacterium]
MPRLLLIAVLVGLILYIIKNAITPPKPARLPPDFFRVPGETLNLIFSIGISFFVLLVLLRVTFGLILLGVVGAVVMVKLKQSQLLGQGIKVSETQLPEVYEAVETASIRLGMEQPDVYVIQSQEINAYAMGVIGKKTVVLHSKTIECMSEGELISILGHEFSHILCGHTKWIALTSSARFVRIPLVSMVLDFIFLFWSRKAEYTCDRGGLIASADLNASITALIKLSVGEHLFKQLNLSELLSQKEALDSDIFSRLSEKMSTHPYIVKRIVESKRFHDSELYSNFVKYRNMHPNEGPYKA